MNYYKKTMNRKSIYYFALFFILLSGAVMPNTSLGQNSTNLLDKMNQRFSLDIPASYSNKLRGFVSNSATLNLDVAAYYTESFIIKQMATDQGISKSNQYLFIWDRIYAVLSNSELYDGNDGDEKRYKEYEIAFDFVLSCEKEYKENLKEVLEKEQQKSKDDAQKAKDDLQKSKDDLQKSKDDLQKSKDDLQKSKDDAIKADKKGLEELVNYYMIYKKDPSSALDSELQAVREIANDLINTCRKHDLDYSKYLLQYMKDEKEVEALIKFYGIE